MRDYWGNRLIWAVVATVALVVPVQAAGYVIKDETYFMQDGVMTPDEIAEEGAYLRELCETNAYQSLYFDCGCLGDALVAKRTELGPEVMQFTIVEGLTKSKEAVCPNSEGIRQHKLDECVADLEGGWLEQRIGDYNPTREDMMGFCQCNADRFVETFSAAPRLSTSYIRGIAVDTHMACLKPEDR